MQVPDDEEHFGARVERIEPDHLVSMADIARRAGLTRAAISLYAKGMRAQEFPAPVARVTSEIPLWDWWRGGCAAPKIKSSLCRTLCRRAWSGASIC